MGLTSKERTKQGRKGAEPERATSPRSLVNCEKNAAGFQSHRGAKPSARDRARGQGLPESSTGGVGVVLRESPGLQLIWKGLPGGMSLGSGGSRKLGRMLGQHDTQAPAPRWREGP